MRESIKGFSSGKPFEINELEERSHFSPPQPSQDIVQKNVSFQERAKPNGNYQSETIAKPSSKQHQQSYHTNSHTQQKSICLPLQFQNSQLLSCQQTKNSNSKSTMYAFVMYLGIFLYMCDFFVLIVPALNEMGRINKVTEIVLEFFILLIVFVMIVSYEKARRTSPGYPMSLAQRYKVNKVQQAIALPQIQQLKSHTMSLLIKKAQLKQALQKNSSQQTQQHYQSFEYKFCVQQTKWCQKCLNIKLARVRHCSECNRCIERMDHHCVWLNNCVGRRNHKFFILFLLFLIIILTLFAVLGAVQLFGQQEDNSVAKYLETTYGALWKVLYIIGEIFATGLWFYYVFVFCEQLYLIMNNLTFVESLSHILAEKKPWKKDSCCENLREVFGFGCWICPTAIYKRAQLPSENQQNKKNPSVQLVQEVLGGNGNQLTNFESQNHFRQQRNQI